MHYQYAHPEFFDGIPRPDFRALSGNLVIYGAGFQGKLAAHLLREQGIEVLCFGDRDERKQSALYCGLPVLDPEEMKQRYPGAIPIVATYVLRPAWEYVTQKLGYENALTPFSLLLEFDSDSFDRLEGHPFWYHPGVLDYFVDLFMQKCINVLTERSLYATDISVTQVCNLRCKCCNAFMPCYKEPRHFELEDVIYDAKALLQDRAFHHIFLEGGEAFLWKPLPELLQFLSENPNVMNIWVVTNGTVLPHAELLQALGLPKVAVRISNYEGYSKIVPLSKMLKQNQIKHWIYQQQWFELESFYEQPIYGERLDRVISSCNKMGGGSTYVSDGKLFRCPTQANLHNLGIFLSTEVTDYVNLRQKDSVKMQKEIAAFIDQKHMTRAPALCAYCNSRGYIGEEVPPAEQLNPGESIQVCFK